MEKSKVYFIKEINKENIVKIYQALDCHLDGKVGIKVHSGEMGNQNFLKPDLYQDIVKMLDGTIIECNTAYEGSRNTTEKHLETLKEHEWSKYYKTDILDSEGEMILPIKGKHLDGNYVGSHLKNYDSLLILSHFKGHPMGGFGGALKNISIGLASSHGKANIHGAGNPDKLWSTEQNAFLESMAEADKSVMDYVKEIVFINIVANLSVDCDCCAIAEDPCMTDVGILASLDPVALDQACIDLIYNSKDEGKKDLIERIESRNGIHTLEETNRLNVGSRDYELINI